MQASVGWGRGQVETGQVTRTSVNTHVGQTLFEVIGRVKKYFLNLINRYTFRE